MGRQAALLLHGTNSEPTATTPESCPDEFDPSAKANRGPADARRQRAVRRRELERLLRPYDRDATSLPGRLAASPPALLRNVLWQRTTVTTDSWDVPCPSAAIPADVLARAATTPTTSLTDRPCRLFSATARFRPAEGPGDEGGKPHVRRRATAVMSSLLPPELLAGRKMDLNRAFGNGLDDNGNGVVDDHRRTRTPNCTVGGGRKRSRSTQAGRRQHLVRDGKLRSGRRTTPPPAGLQARQLYARYLYVLAMLLVDPTGLQTRTPIRRRTLPIQRLTFRGSWPNGR